MITTAQAFFTAARVDLRCRAALTDYRYARSRWKAYRTAPLFLEAVVARERWTTLADVLAVPA